jgi:hypothetical protein
MNSRILRWEIKSLRIIIIIITLNFNYLRKIMLHYANWIVVTIRKKWITGFHLTRFTARDSLSLCDTGLRSAACQIWRHGHVDIHARMWNGQLCIPMPSSPANDSHWSRGWLVRCYSKYPAIPSSAPQLGIPNPTNPPFTPPIHRPHVQESLTTNYPHSSLFAQLKRMKTKGKITL